MAPSLEAINAALATVNDPEINRPITEIGMLKGVDIAVDGTVTADDDGCALVTVDLDDRLEVFLRPA